MTAVSWMADLEARTGPLAPELAQRIADELAALRERFPAAPEPDARFVELLAARISPTVHAADLFLAWWCEGGTPAAIAAFEQQLDDELRQATNRFRDLHADELRQLLRIKLFVGTKTAPPRIRDYAGTGPLRSWLRVTAVRTFVDVTRSTRAERYQRELDEADLFGDPRGEQVRPDVSAAIKRAFAEAVARLAPRQRVFLRHASVERLTLDQIAEAYSIHRATVARTLQTARAQLIEQTRAAVATEIGVTPDELSSAMGMFDSRMDLSLSRVLKSV
jgi:RNA polymerase sigma-70 factor, ECF subfamily